MIITVTLNAAIDKSLSVPSFRLGRRHRTVEQRTMPGGKGVNVARSLKTLGRPVIADRLRGRRRRARGSSRQLTEESILNDFVRIREESRTNTSVHDPTTGTQTEINERGPEVTAKEAELFRDKLLYLASGAEIVVFAGSLPRGLEPVDLRGPHPRTAPDERDDRRRRRRRADAAGDPRRAARRLTERPRGRGARRSRVPRGGRSRRRGRRAVRPGRRASRSSRCRTAACRACSSTGGGERHRVWIEPREAVAERRRGRRVPRRRTCPPATRVRPRRSACGFGVACGAESTQRLGAGLIDPKGVERLLAEVDVERIETPAETV